MTEYKDNLFTYDFTRYRHLKVVNQKVVSNSTCEQKQNETMILTIFDRASSSLFIFF